MICTTHSDLKNLSWTRAHNRGSNRVQNTGSKWPHSTICRILSQLLPHPCSTLYPCSKESGAAHINNCRCVKRRTTKERKPKKCQSGNLIIYMSCTSIRSKKLGAEQHMGNFKLSWERMALIWLSPVTPDELCSSLYLDQHLSCSSCSRYLYNLGLCAQLLQYFKQELSDLSCW